MQFVYFKLKGNKIFTDQVSTEKSSQFQKSLLNVTSNQIGAFLLSLHV